MSTTTTTPNVIPADMITAIIAAYRDTDRVLANRVKTIGRAVDAGYQVKDIRAALIESAPADMVIVSETVLGFARGAHVALASTGAKITDSDRATVHRAVEAVKVRAFADAWKIAGKSFTENTSPADKLAKLLEVAATAIDSKAARRKESAERKPRATESGAESATESGAVIEESPESVAYQHLLAVIRYYERGGKPTADLMAGIQRLTVAQTAARQRVAATA